MKNAELIYGGEAVLLSALTHFCDTGRKPTVAVMYNTIRRRAVSSRKNLPLWLLLRRSDVQVSKLLVPASAHDRTLTVTLDRGQRCFVYQCRVSEKNWPAFRATLELLLLMEVIRSGGTFYGRRYETLFDCDLRVYTS